MYSDAITLHEFLALCDDCWTGIPMRKKAVFWLMRGDRKRRIMDQHRLEKAPGLGSEPGGMHGQPAIGCTGTSYLSL